MHPQNHLHTPPWRSAVIGLLCGLVISLVVMAPARWLNGTVIDLTGGRLRWHDIQGTVWSGSAQWALSDGMESKNELAIPGRISWAWSIHLQPRPTLELQLSMPCCSANPISAQLVWADSLPQLMVQDIPATSPLRIPAKLLSALGAPMNSLQPEGTLALSGQSIRVPLRNASWSGQLQLDIENLQSSISTLQTLGSYRLQIQGGSETTLELSTIKGGLILQGQGQLLGGRWHFQGFGQASPENEAALSNLLNIIGRRQGSRSIIQIG